MSSQVYLRIGMLPPLKRSSVCQGNANIEISSLFLSFSFPQLLCVKYYRFMNLICCYANELFSLFCRCVKQSGKSPVMVSSFGQGFRNVKNGACDYYYTLQGQILTQSRGRYCGQLTAVGKPFFDTSVSFVLPKNSSLTSLMSMETLLLREVDLLESSSKYADRLSCPEVTDATITLSKLKLFFYIAFGGLTLILLFMILDSYIGSPGPATDTFAEQPTNMEEFQTPMTSA